MGGVLLEFSFLFLCWVSALVTLVAFLESWFALADRKGLPARRASGAYGVVSVLMPLRGPVERTGSAIRSVFDQSYPFIELVLIVSEDDLEQIDMARRCRVMRSHIPVRIRTTSFPLGSEPDRVRALEQFQSELRGQWLVVVDADVVLDRYAIESALEFAGAEEVSALVLAPGIYCRSLFQRLLAPPLEWISRMTQVIDRRSDVRTPAGGEAFLLMNRQAHEAINRINRMPGILNEAGWNLWSFKMEGLKTFEADGSGWMWREASPASWMSRLGSRHRRSRALAVVFGSAFSSMLAVAGVVFGLTVDRDSFSTASILYFSAFSYGLMATSYFLYSRWLRTSPWFSPVWFLAHLLASTIILVSLGRTMSQGSEVRSQKPEVRSQRSE